MIQHVEDQVSPAAGQSEIRPIENRPNPYLDAPFFPVRGLFG
jgi:hypothetical protein